VDVARSGSITIAGQPFTVNQAAAACTYTIAPMAQTVEAPGGPVTITVTAGAWCGWTAASNAPWLTIAAGATGTGNGTVSVTVDPNTGSPRTGTVTVAGQTLTVNQNP